MPPYMIYPLFIWLGKRLPAALTMFITLLAGMGIFAAATLLTEAGEPRNLWQQAAPAVFWKWALGALLAEVLLNACPLCAACWQTPGCCYPYWHCRTRAPSSKLVPSS